MGNSIGHWSPCSRPLGKHAGTQSTSTFTPLGQLCDPGSTAHRQARPAGAREGPPRGLKPGVFRSIVDLQATIYS